MNRSKLFALLLLSTLAFAAPAECAWIWSPDLGKWINPKKAAKDTPEEQYDWALQFLDKKDWDRATEEFEKLIETFPTSRLAAEAAYYIGTAWEAKDDLAKAADAYQKLIDKYPYSDRIKDAIKREFEIANELATGKVKVLGMPLLSGQEKAVELYNHIIKNAPYGSYGDQAQFKLAELYKSQGEYELSRKAFQTVIDEYPNSELVPRAKYEIANASMAASRDGQYDEKNAEEAIEQFQSFKSTFPQDNQTVMADESIKAIRAEKAARNYDVAAFYRSQKKWKSAKVYFEQVARDYPDTPSGAKAKKEVEDMVRRETGSSPSPKKKRWLPW
jgi:outer membrane assembly lipoprotein YfiO